MDRAQFEKARLLKEIKWVFTKGLFKGDNKIPRRFQRLYQKTKTPKIREITKKLYNDLFDAEFFAMKEVVKILKEVEKDLAEG